MGWRQRLKKRRCVKVLRKLEDGALVLRRLLTP
jgi:hypothetical protein